MAQEITKDYILSEDGQFVLGKKNRTDSHGKPLPEMYKKKIPVKNMMNLVGGKQTPEQAAKARASTENFYGDRYEKFFSYLEKGHSRSRAAKKASIPWGTIRERMKVDPVFLDQMNDVELIAADAVYDMVYESILETKDVERGLKWLSKFDARFEDKRVSVNTEVRRVELEAGKGVEGVLALLSELGERRALSSGSGKVIDVESTEEVL